MKRLNRDLVESSMVPAFVETYFDDPGTPERVVQFGEGNFLRGFVDWMIHQLNKQGLFNGKVVAVQPTPHGRVVPKLNEQDGLYTFVLQGIEDGEVIEKYEIISSISRGIDPYRKWEEVLALAESPTIEYIFSNTTEAGLTYIPEAFDLSQSPISFPGKLTVFLYQRFKTTNGDPSAGLSIIPCELVENNGDLLKEYVLRHSFNWNLGKDFMDWVTKHNDFCNTLVDRIVPGYPKKAINHFQELLGYEDQLIGVGEPYHLFAIEATKNIIDRIPFDKVGLNVKWGDVAPFRQLKLSILNAPHTMLFSVGFLAGLNTVYEVMEDKELSQFVKSAIFDEILSVISFDEKEKVNFAHSVIERFQNPFVDHYLADIGLNGISKFKTRVLPLLLNWSKNNNQIPPFMSFSLAALIDYYRPIRMVDKEHMIGIRDDVEYKVRDSEEAILTLSEAWNAYDGTCQGVEQTVKKTLENQRLWGENLGEMNGLHGVLCNHLENILQFGMRESLSRLLRGDI